MGSGSTPFYKLIPNVMSDENVNEQGVEAGEAADESSNDTEQGADEASADGEEVAA